MKFDARRATFVEDARTWHCSFGGDSESYSYQTTQNTSNVDDRRVGVADDGTALVTGDGGTNNVTVNTQITNTTTDQGALDAATTITTAGLGIVSDAVASAGDVAVAGISGNTTVSTRAIDKAAQAATDAANAAAAAASAALTAQRQTADSAISGIRSISSDALELARASGADAYRFAHDTASGYIDASVNLNNLVGAVGVNDQKFATTLVDQVLARSQSADQQNFEATLDLLKKLGIAAAVVIAVVFVVPAIAKAK